MSVIRFDPIIAVAAGSVTDISVLGGPRSGVLEWPPDSSAVHRGKIDAEKDCPGSPMLAGEIV